MARSSYTDPWVKRSRWLTQALIISGTLNAGLLSSVIYSVVKESQRPLSGRPYVAKEEHTSVQKGLQEFLTAYSTLPYQELLLKLSDIEQVEAGYTHRDVALACLVHFHHFNLEKALGSSALERRQICIKEDAGIEGVVLEIFPGLTDAQYQAIVAFVKTERWPLTAKGLFCNIQSARLPYDSTLLEAFYLTAEFHFLHLLFSKTGIGLKKEHLAALLAQASWSSLTETAHLLQVENAFDLVHRRRFLLKLLNEDSKLAAKILLEADQEYCFRSLDNDAVIRLCHLLGDWTNTGFLKGLLASPRPDAVRKTAAAILYQQAAEQVPEHLDLQAAKRRFIELKMDPAPLDHQAPVYTVTPGDSLWKIARQHNTTVNKLKQANRLQSDTLKVGQTLKIPNQDPAKR